MHNYSQSENANTANTKGGEGSAPHLAAAVAAAGTAAACTPAPATPPAASAAPAAPSPSPAAPATPEYAHALKVLAAIEATGAEAWFVGGFVRDALLGRACADIDVATSATWQEVKRACTAAGMHAHETGTRHGTITIISEGTACEVTTFRVEGTYSDARHPDSVRRAASIEEDLARRDFTINALAWHPVRGLRDPFGGAADMAAGVIRCVGNPHERFSEDALRILRACRFSSQLGFAIDADNLQAMQQNKYLLSRVSTERITHELDCLLLGAHPHQAIVSTADVLAFVLPELAAMKDCQQLTKYHCYTVLEHCAAAVQAAQPSRLVRWAALCHDMGKPAAAFTSPDGVDHFYGHAHVSAQLAAGIATRLLMSNAFKTNLTTLVANHDKEIAPTTKSVKRALANLDGNVDLMRNLLDLKRADALSHAPEYRSCAHVDAVEQVLNQILAQGSAFSIKSLAITGKDLIGEGFAEGPQIGQALKDALNAVINEEIPNEKRPLLTFCKTLQQKQ